MSSTSGKGCGHVSQGNRSDGGTGIDVAGTACRATPIYIQSPATTLYQQTTNSPCVVGNESCSGALPYAHINDFLVGGGGTTNYTDALSPVYTFAQLAGVLGIAGSSGAFIVGVDVNWAGDHPPQELLTEFDIFVDGVVRYSLGAPFEFVYTANGNGWSDALIYQNAALAAFPLLAGHTYQFNVSLTQGADGQEQVLPDQRGVAASASASACRSGAGVDVAPRHRTRGPGVQGSSQEVARRTLERLFYLPFPEHEAGDRSHPVACLVYTEIDPVPAGPI